MKIKTDSRKIQKGDIFVALRGVKNDGHNYIEEAIKNGASMIVNEEKTYNVPTIIVSNTRAYLAETLALLFKDTLDKITLIGITGTNGKTTSCFLTYQLLNLLGKKCAYIGTIGFYIEDKVRDLGNTTPDIGDIYEMFEECIEHDVEVIVMEVSSHALAMDRILGIKYDIGVFTNLTQDHLDFHSSIEEYCRCKQRLFTMLKKNKISIINSDDENKDYFLFNDNHNITFGEKGEFKIKDYQLAINKSSLTLEYNHHQYPINLNIPCKYNLYNYLVSLIIAYQLGYNLEDIIDKTPLLKAPKGRFETLEYNDNVIVVDYAHTPDALENILKNVQDYKNNHIITIIGCGGDRDRTKRPIMGDIATKYSDHVIFTNDNPRSEDDHTIMNDIIKELENNNYEIIYNREEAIKKGIDRLKNNDILLILGKGHETYQIIGKEKLPFDDWKLAKKYISSFLKP
jgi:UDP-N-acetylmuramoyl-L-alanyl-D-glutamate--2,6-diaminopimelate ligase